MLILIGGAARSGKGIISRALVQRTGVPLLPLDVLKMGLHRAMPSVGIDPEAASAEIGARMWPLLEAMAETALESGVDCIFEGDMLLPEHAAELADAWGHEVGACFVGYREIEPSRKLAEIRRFAGLPNDWLSERDDEYVMGQVRFGIAFSDDLASGCQRLGLKYFDSSRDFGTTVKLAVEHLVELLESESRSQSSAIRREVG